MLWICHFSQLKLCSIYNVKLTNQKAPEVADVRYYLYLQLPYELSILEAFLEVVQSS